MSQPPIDPRSLSYETRLPEGGYSPLRAMIAWLVIVACVGTILLNMERPADDQAFKAVERERTMKMMGKYVVGNRTFVTNAEQVKQMLVQLEQPDATPIDKIRLAIVTAEVGSPQEALAALDAIETSLAEASTRPNPLDAVIDVPVTAEDAPRVSPTMKLLATTHPVAPPTTSPAAELADDIRALRRIYSSEGEPVVHPADAERLHARHEWFGDLAIAFHQPADSPARQAALGPARSMFVKMLSVMGGGLILILAALVMFILAIVFVCTGKIRSNFSPSTRRSTAFLEAFAIFLLALTTMGWVMEPLQTYLHIPPVAILPAMLIIPLVWPRLAGHSWAEVREGFGIHRGRGVFVEVLSGVAGYLAGVPILVVGMIVTVILLKLTHSDGSHPIIREIGGSSVKTLLIFILAAVWAPISEELVFRGALFHHCRQKWHWIPAAALVALIFAVIHPQGLAVVPALASIGFVFAMIRQWRGSIIGSMTAHAMHNGMLVAVATMLLS